MLDFEPLLVPGDYSLDGRDMGPTRPGRAVQHFTVKESEEVLAARVTLERE